MYFVEYEFCSVVRTHGPTGPTTSRRCHMSIQVRREGSLQAGTGSTCEARTGFGTSRAPPVLS